MSIAQAPVLVHPSAIRPWLAWADRWGAYRLVQVPTCAEKCGEAWSQDAETYLHCQQTAHIRWSLVIETADGADALGITRWRPCDQLPAAVLERFLESLAVFSPRDGFGGAA